MKIIQLRMSDEVYEEVLKLRAAAGSSMTELIRRSLGHYKLLREYQDRGKKVVVLDGGGTQEREVVA